MIKSCCDKSETGLIRAFNNHFGGNHVQASTKALRDSTVDCKAETLRPITEGDKTVMLSDVTELISESIGITNFSWFGLKYWSSLL